MIELLKNIVQKLENLEIPYMLSGSLDLNAYRTPRMTRDIDIVIYLQTKDINNFVKSFEQDFYCCRPTIEEEVQRKGMFNLIQFNEL